MVIEEEHREGGSTSRRSSLLTTDRAPGGPPRNHKCAPEQAPSWGKSSNAMRCTTSVI